MEISCTDFQTVADAGGNCPADTANSLALFKELSSALTPLGKLVSLASQAGKPQEVEENIAAIWPYVDHFNLMTCVAALASSPFPPPNPTRSSSMSLPCLPPRPPAGTTTP